MQRWIEYTRGLRGHALNLVGNFRLVVDVQDILLRIYRTTLQLLPQHYGPDHLSISV
jgi:hypothetical protein